MYYKTEFCLTRFDAWSGAVDTKEAILAAGLENEFNDLLEDIFCEEAPTETEINDYLWFNSNDIYKMLGLNEDRENIE